MSIESKTKEGKTPKDKAIELVSRFFNDYGEKRPDGKFDLCIVSKGRAKQCATIATEELIESWKSYLNMEMYDQDFFNYELKYWETVKTEIQLL